MKTTTTTGKKNLRITRPIWLNTSALAQAPFGAHPLIGRKQKDSKMT
jgi:hypothetical protein